MRGAFNQIAPAKHCDEAPGKCINQIYFLHESSILFYFKKESTVFVLDVDRVKQLEKQ